MSSTIAPLDDIGSPVSTAKMKREVEVMQNGAFEKTVYSSQCSALHIKVNSRVKAKGGDEWFSKERTIDLSSNYVGGAGFQAMIDSIAANPDLETLVASGNGLSNTSVVFFARAMANHPTLKVVDLSDNPISLPAGLALIDLAHKNPRIAEIKLNNTNIDDAVLRRLRRCLNLNKTPAREPARNIAGLTPFQKATQEHERRTGPKKEAALKDKTDKEGKATADMLAYLVAHKDQIPTPERREGGWAVVNLVIDASPGDFKSEVELIHQLVIPKLNKAFAHRKVYFVPQFMHSDIPSNYHQTLPTVGKSAVVDDYNRWTAKATPFYVHLIGDKFGLFEHPTTEQSNSGEAHSSVKPVMHRVYENSQKLSHGTSIAMIRQSVQRLGIPSGLMPLMSDNPQLVHPDANAEMVKVAVAQAQGLKHKLADFDAQLEKNRWQEHIEFKRNVATEHEPSFLVNGYPGEYDCIDNQGFIRLKNLETFVTSLTKRLVALAQFHFPEHPKNRYIAADYNPTRLAWFQQSPDVPTGKRHLVGKLELYTVTPPSRNMALVYGGPGTGSTSVLRAYIKRNTKRENYLLASHFTKQVTVMDEPSDPKSVFVHLMSQLMPDKVVPTHIATEVDVDKVKEHLQQALSTAAAELPEGHLLVLVVDGLDTMDTMVLPCENLRVTDTGMDAWHPPPANSTVQQRPPKVVAKRDHFDWIPVCLARNVRVIGSTTTNSAAHNVLGQRGHDSCEPIFTGELGENDIESIVLQETQKMGIELSEEHIAIIRSKVDSRSPEYLRFLFDVLVQRGNTPQYTSLMAVLQQLPHTVEELCVNVLRDLELAVGVPIAKLCVSLLLVSRWGLLEVELRELLVKYAPALGHGNTTAGRLLNTEIFETILRKLNPVLQPMLQKTESSPLNALDCIVYLESGTFCSIASQRYFTDDQPVEASINATAANAGARRLSALSTATGGTRASLDTGKGGRGGISQQFSEQLHHQLAHYFRRIAQTNDHPLQSRALKEMAYHIVEGGMWTTFDESVVTLEYISLCYKFGLGYHSLRELIRAFNKLDAVKPAHSHGQPAADGNHDALKLKLKEYVYFVRDHNINLVQYPHMVRQIAITCGTDTHLNKDAREFFKSRADQPHFAVVNRTKGKLHREGITACTFAPSGLRFASASLDRAIKICALNGEPLLSINQSVSRISRLSYSRTSRYLIASCEDHSILVFDASNGAVISNASAHTAQINSISMSARGRFVLSGSEDRTMRVYESETGVLIATVNHQSFAHNTSAFGGVGEVQTHPFEEDRFFSMCDKKILTWKLASSRDACDQVQCFNCHNSLPVANFHLILDGQFMITTAKDLVTPGPNSSRAEDNIKVWSLGTGRQVAAFTMGCKKNQPGPIFSEISPTESILASALFDGGLQLHHIDARSFAPDGEEPMIVTPYRSFPAFQDHPSPTLSRIRFSFDSKFVCATGNQRQLKVWSALTDGAYTAGSATPTSTVRGTSASVRSTNHEDSTDTDRPPATTSTAVAFTAEGNVAALPTTTEMVNETAAVNRVIEEAAAATLAKNENDATAAALTATAATAAAAFLTEPVAEFLMDQPSTCMDWTPNPTDDGAELIVGDSVGRLRALRLKH